MNMLSKESSELKQTLEIKSPEKDTSDRPEKKMVSLEQILIHLEKMKASLLKESAIDFKEVWGVKKIIVDMFKSCPNSPDRTKAWSEYTELSKEEKRLKHLAEEASVFIVRQLETAISSTESEVDAFRSDEYTFLQSQSFEAFPDGLKSISNREDFYVHMYKRLSWLNICVSRVVTLRKELVQTVMQVRVKNNFFKRLSDIGDFVFPLRKAVIKDVSESFSEAVQVFVERNFSEKNFSVEKARRSIFSLRSEIRGLQQAAKMLVLNSQSFAYTRSMLSECWDKLKGLEKEVKKQQVLDKSVSIENTDKIKAHICSIMEKLDAGSITNDKALSDLDMVSRGMRKTILVHTDVIALKDLLRSNISLIDSKIKEHEAIKQQHEAEKEEARKEKSKELRSKIDDLSSRIDSDDISTLVLECATIKKLVLSSSIFNKSEKAELEIIFKSFKDQLDDRKEQALLSLSADDKAALTNLKVVIAQRRDRRKEIKDKIESYRKVIGGSCLDFEKAMEYNSLITAEKEQLIVMEDSILELEARLLQLKGKLA